MYVCMELYKYIIFNKINTNYPWGLSFFMYDEIINKILIKPKTYLNSSKYIF